jgi:hypothetical protein
MVAFSRDIPHTVSIGVDQASPHAASERSKMSTVIHSLPSPSPIEKPTRGRSLELVLTKAKARVANYIRNADGNGLDPFLMVVEDEFGDLVHTQGDLSFLMPSAPVLHQWFASQLNTEIKDQYDRRQLAVWQKMLVDGEQFQVAPKLNAAILPFLAEEERFTVTVFIPRTTNKW